MIEFNKLLIKNFSKVTWTFSCNVGKTHKHSCQETRQPLLEQFLWQSPLSHELAQNNCEELNRSKSSLYIKPKSTSH